MDATSSMKDYLEYLPTLLEDLRLNFSSRMKIRDELNRDIELEVGTVLFSDFSPD